MYNVVIIHMSAPDTSLVITSQAATWDTCRHAQSRVEMLAVATRQLQDILHGKFYLVISFLSVLVHGTSIMISIMIFVSVLGIFKYLPINHLQISNMNMN